MDSMPDNYHFCGSGKLEEKPSISLFNKIGYLSFYGQSFPFIINATLHSILDQLDEQYHKLQFNNIQTKRISALRKNRKIGFLKRILFFDIH